MAANRPELEANVPVLEVHYSLILAAHLAALFLRETGVVNGVDSGAAVAHISIGVAPVVCGACLCWHC